MYVLTSFVVVVLAIVASSLIVKILSDRLTGRKQYDSAFSMEVSPFILRVSLYFFACNIFYLLSNFQTFVMVLLSLAIWTFIETAQVTALRYFELPLHRIMRHLPIKIGDDGALGSTLLYAKQYLPLKYAASILAVGLAGLLTQAFSLGTVGSFAGAGLLAATSLLVLALPKRDDRSVSSIERELSLRDDKLELKRLWKEDRSRAVHLEPDEPLLAQNIVLILNESAGADISASTGTDRTLAEALSDTSGNRDDWLTPANAITNSSCTDISIPSILTGCGSHEDIAKLHQLPMIFDLARARGFRTAFLTSSTLKWANFQEFFSGTSLDYLYSAYTENLELINDLTADDYIVARKAGDWIDQAHGRVLIVIYLNSLHVPFQNTSQCAIPSGITNRKNRAAYITEESHRLVFEALRRTGRYENAFIASIGDHGETIGNDGSDATLRAARAIKLTRSILEPLFVLKPPSDLPSRLLKNLKMNLDTLIQNADIAPTIAQLLGLRLANGLKYHGTSLFEVIPLHRIVYVVNTNQWRSWPKSAVAIARRSDRVVVDYQSAEHLCLSANGTPFADKDHDIRDALLSAAAKEVIVQKSITRIFKDKVGSAPPH